MSYEFKYGNDVDLATMRQDAEAWVQRQIALEREQMRIAKVQREQARQIAEHEARITKNEEEIAKLQFRMDEAERTLAYYQKKLDGIQLKRRELDNKIWWYEKKGLACGGMKKELEKLDDQVFKFEGRVRKAKFDMELASKKLSA